MADASNNNPSNDPELIARLNTLYEWFCEVTSQEDFEWPEDFDPEAYLQAANQLLEE